ncbi:MAG: PilZ domain-containing protein [Marinicaulis sp.]|nr:PilZ domain-containing protein [Marinicaulis sp.]NNL87453.1 PilZ domain-containing protein [Marinicaulis sp.]
MFGKKPDPKVEARLAAMKSKPVTDFKSMKPVETKVDRAVDRQTVYKFGLIFTDENLELRCIVRDLSPDGAKLTLDGADGLPQTFKLAIDGYSAPAQARLIWQEESDVGIAFD